MKETYTCVEVAKMYQVKTATVWGWIRQKKLPALRIGRDYRIRPDDLMRFEQDRATTSL